MGGHLAAGWADSQFDPAVELACDAGYIVFYPFHVGKDELGLAVEHPAFRRHLPGFALPVDEGHAQLVFQLFKTHAEGRL